MSQVVVPDIGDFKEVEVIEVLVKPGDVIAKEQSLVSLESDKATMEIPSPESGVVQSIKVKVGDKVSEGSVLLSLEPGAAAVEKNEEPKKPEPAEKPKPVEAAKATAAAAPPAAPSVVTRVEPVPSEPRDAVTSLPHAS